MARGNGEGTITKRKDGTWCGRITVGYDEKGRQQRKAFYGKTRREVQDKMAAAQDEINRTKAVFDSNTLFGVWLDYWLVEYKKRNVSPATYCINKAELDTRLKPKFGDIKIKNLKPTMFQELINSMADEGLTRATIVITISVLHQSLNQALENGMIRANPAKGLKLPQEKKPEMRVLSPDEQIKFINTSCNYPVGELFILMLATGLRFGEATALQWHDIDFSSRIIHVNKTISTYFDRDETKASRYIISPGKTKASNRTVPVLPSVLEMLERRQPSEPCGNDLVFKSDARYAFITKGKASYWFRKILAESKIERNGLHIHSLRHTFATRCLENGIELKLVQEILGHSSIDMTANIYTHVLPDKKKESIDKLSHTIRLGVEGYNDA